jgi:DNA-binding IclR family transcriptional regulator
MCSVAAPLGPNCQAPTISIGATGSVRVFSPAFARKTGKELISMASDLSERIGWGDREPARASA